MGELRVFRLSISGMMWPCYKCLKLKKWSHLNSDSGDVNRVALVLRGCVSATEAENWRIQSRRSYQQL